MYYSVFFPFSYRLIRPVGNSTDRLTVKMGLKLSQIIGVDMKRQILITNVWLEQVIWLKKLRPITFDLMYFIFSFRNGSIISSNGILQTTGTFATCMYLLSIFGYQTLCSTISEYDVYTMGDTLLFCCWRVIIMISWYPSHDRDAQKFGQIELVDIFFAKFPKICSLNKSPSD